VTDPQSELRFRKDRVDALLHTLERLAAGDTQTSPDISPRHDELDAIAFGINVLADELKWAHARITESERVKADELRERALRRSDANFATAFHSNPCAMTITRLSDGRFQDVNQSFERQTGFRRDEVIGRTVEEFGMWIDPDDLAAVASAVVSGGRLNNFEVRFRTKSGAPATCVYSADIITFGGEPCVLAVGLDITDRKNSEIQAAKLREELAHLGRVTMLDALTGSLAHEINQPLTAVMANAEAALRFIAAEPPRLRELRETLDEIVSANKRAGEVVRRMRTLLKKSATLYEPLEVNSTIQEVLKLIQGNALGRRIMLDVELASDIDPVLGDRIQIQQVVINLLLNAFDAVQEREAAERRVRLRTARRDSTAVIEVSDHGAGLPDEALARIFEPFYTTKRDGLGLGLSICRAIVGAHGGMLDATRNPGRGLTFSASFPLLVRMPAGPQPPRRLQERP
jgi:two-component system, LuxR family, sensor kinase FixL